MKMREKTPGGILSKADSVACVAPTGDWCGEGAIWHPEERAVFWVDNRRDLIHRFLVEDSSVRTWIFDETVAALALTVDPQTLCVVLGSRLLLWTPATDRRQPCSVRLEDWPAVRFNDAGVDPQGMLWLGSMGNNLGPDGIRREVPQGAGSLFKLCPEGKLETKVSGIGVANTIAWSPDGAHFYSADSLANEIRVYDCDRETGEIRAPRPFFSNFRRGRPDGSAVDSEGSLWNCRYGGGCIVRLSAQGETQDIIELPSINVTSCVFGGDDLRTLFVTTAITAMPDTQRLGRFDGGLFAIATDVGGQPDKRRMSLVAGRGAR